MIYKKELVKKLAEKLETSQKKASEIMDVTLGCITEAAVKDGVSLLNFGTIKAVKRSARNYRNPQTGETIKVKAHKTLVFKPCKQLKNFK